MIVILNETKLTKVISDHNIQTVNFSVITNNGRIEHFPSLEIAKSWAKTYERVTKKEQKAVR